MSFNGEGAIHLRSQTRFNVKHPVETTRNRPRALGGPTTGVIACTKQNSTLARFVQTTSPDGRHGSNQMNLQRGMNRGSVDL
jgi:hypothetical protein